MGEILSTQKELADAVAPLDARLAIIESNPVLTATDCNGAVLAENAKLAQCNDTPSEGGAVDTVAIMNDPMSIRVWGGEYELGYSGAMPTFELGGGNYSPNPTDEWYSHTTASNVSCYMSPNDPIKPQGVLSEAKIKLQVEMVYNASVASMFTPNAQVGDPVRGSNVFRVHVKLYSDYLMEAIEWVSPTYSTPTTMPTAADDYVFLMPNKPDPWADEYLTSAPTATAYFRPGSHSLEMRVQYMTSGPTPFDIKVTPKLSFQLLYGAATPKF